MPPRPIDKPFRMTITNVYESPFGKLNGHCLSGKIEGGILRKEDKLVILPLEAQCVVKDLIVGGEKGREAVVGDNIDIHVKMIDKTAFEAIKQGHVLSSLKFSVPVTRRIIVEALALDLEVPVLRGTEVVIYIATNKCPARITRINCIFNPSDGTIIKKNPKSIKANECAEIEVELGEKMCAELFSNYKTFGRVILREKKDTLFVGTIKMIK
jgi:elongation factor 1 alpha-like protein